jgi:hypothetical protein
MGMLYENIRLSIIMLFHVLNSAHSPSPIFSIIGSSRGEQNNKGQKPSICTLCDPECQPGLVTFNVWVLIVGHSPWLMFYPVAPGLKDKILNCKRFNARWPYSSPYGESLLSVFLIIINTWCHQSLYYVVMIRWWWKNWAEVQWLSLSTLGGLWVYFFCLFYVSSVLSNIWLLFLAPFNYWTFIDVASPQAFS